MTTLAARKSAEKHEPLKSFFDEEFYRRKYRIQANDKMTPFEHYVTVGRNVGNWPNAYFDNEFYQKFKQSGESVQNDPAIYNYPIRTSELAPNRFFNAAWYLKRYPDVRNAGLDPFEHFVRLGDAEHRSPGPSFDSLAYRKLCKSNGIECDRPLRTFLHNHALPEAGVSFTKSFKDLVIESGEFDQDFYLSCNPDVGAAGWHALDHFLQHGAYESRDPNADFDSIHYASIHPEYVIHSAAPFELFLRNEFVCPMVLSGGTYASWLRRYDYLERLPGKGLEVTAKREALSSADLLLSFGQASTQQIALILRSVANLVTPVGRIIVVTENSEVANRSAIETIAEKAGLQSLQLVGVESLPSVLQDTNVLICAVGVVLLHCQLSYLVGLERSRSALDVTYSDHDEIDEFGTRGAPSFKPEFSPEYLRNTNYIGQVFSIDWRSAPAHVRTLIVNALAIVDPGMMMQSLLSWENVRVARLPFLLYHTLDRVLIGQKTPLAYQLPEIMPTVTIIIPMRDKASLTRDCLESILVGTQFDLGRVEFFIIDNGSQENESTKFLKLAALMQNVSVFEFRNPFNFSSINNFGASHSDADILIFLNNDTTLIDPDWLKKIVHYAIQEDIGVVGCKLLYADDTIQHGGCVVGAASGLIEHIGTGKRSADVNRTDHNREMSVVTGACIGIRRKVFEALGGFDESLRVAWNDVKLCLSCLEARYRNIYIADALFYHLESQSRGLDVDDEKKATFLREACYVRTRFPGYFFDDPSYNPNLSLESVGRLAVPPRLSLVNISPRPQSRRILMLSIIHNRGYGVPVVIQQQTNELIKAGWEVFIGGPVGETELDYPGCRRINIRSAKAAAIFAFKNEIGVVVAHTPPFFQVTQLLPASIPVIAYDYGEPDLSFFPEPTKTYLKDVAYNKRLSAPLAARRAAISHSVKGESASADTVVIGLGNTHLATWRNSLMQQRRQFRRTQGWDNQIVVLNVCRFATTERKYKGLEKYGEVMAEFSVLFPEVAPRLTWALAGAAAADDIVAMQQRGFAVFPNVSDEKLVELYASSDVYVSFSRWEGYNLGIGQALAMGLPVGASSIEAHREFPIFTSNSTLEMCEWLVNIVHDDKARLRRRKPILFDWAKNSTEFAGLVESVYQSVHGSSRVIADSGLKSDREGRRIQAGRRPV